MKIIFVFLSIILIASCESQLKEDMEKIKKGDVSNLPGSISYETIFEIDILEILQNEVNYLGFLFSVLNDQITSKSEISLVARIAPEIQKKRKDFEFFLLPIDTCSYICKYFNITNPRPTDLYLINKNFEAFYFNISNPQEDDFKLTEFFEKHIEINNEKDVLGNINSQKDFEGFLENYFENKDNLETQDIYLIECVNEKNTNELELFKELIKNKSLIESSEVHAAYSYICKNLDFSEIKLNTQNLQEPYLILIKNYDDEQPFSILQNNLVSNETIISFFKEELSNAPIIKYNILNYHRLLYAMDSVNFTIALVVNETDLEKGDKSKNDLKKIPKSLKEKDYYKEFYKTALETKKNPNLFEENVRFSVLNVAYPEHLNEIFVWKFVKKLNYPSIIAFTWMEVDVSEENIEQTSNLELSVHNFNYTISIENIKQFLTDLEDEQIQENSLILPSLEIPKKSLIYDQNGSVSFEVIVGKNFNQKIIENDAHTFVLICAQKTLIAYPCANTDYPFFALCMQHLKHDCFYYKALTLNLHEIIPWLGERLQKLSRVYALKGLKANGYSVNTYTIDELSKMKKENKTFEIIEDEEKTKQIEEQISNLLEEENENKNAEKKEDL